MPDLSATNTAPPRRARRTPEQQLAELQAQLATLKERAERTKEPAESAHVQVLSTQDPRATRGKRARSSVVRQAQVVAPTQSRLSDSLAMQIQPCIDAFSIDIVELVQRSTMDAVQRALGGIADPNGDPTNNEPRFRQAQMLRPFDLTRSRRLASQSRSKPARSSAVTTNPPLSFEYYERMAIERALAEAGGEVLAASGLLKLTKSSIYRRMAKLGIPGRWQAGPRVVSPDDPLVGTNAPLSLEAYERVAILRALDQRDGNIVAAAGLLKVGKSTLYRRMEELGIPRQGSAR